MAKFYDSEAETKVIQNNLPHWDQGETSIFVTWRLADSLPQEVLKQWRRERTEFEKPHTKPWHKETLILHPETFTDRQEEWLDRGHGQCELKDPKIRNAVAEPFGFFHLKRYFLDSQVIMPNQMHLLLHLLFGFELAKIIHSLKSFTSQKVTPSREADEPFWMEDYHDRLIRSPKPLFWARRYIKNNPQNLRAGWYTLRVAE